MLFGCGRHAAELDIDATMAPLSDLLKTTSKRREALAAAPLSRPMAKAP